MRGEFCVCGTPVKRERRGANAVFYLLYHAAVPSNLPYIPVGQCLGRCPGGSETVPQKALEKRMRSEKGASQGFYRSWPMKTGEGGRQGGKKRTIFKGKMCTAQKPEGHGACTDWPIGFRGRERR